MKKLINKKFIFGFAFTLVTILFLQNCGSTKSAASTEKYITTGPDVSYVADVSPIMTKSCTPCHFPPDGKKEALDSYESVKANIDYILSRVQLPESDMRFMPFKNKIKPLGVVPIVIGREWLYGVDLEAGY